MKLKAAKQPNGLFCTLPRKPEAIKALLALAWKKSKKERPNWLIKEVSNYYQVELEK